jgi:hypothetical protein
MGDRTYVIATIGKRGDNITPELAIGPDDYNLHFEGPMA